MTSHALKNCIFSECEVVKPWNELFEKSVAVDTVEKFQRKLSEFGY